MDPYFLISEFPGLSLIRTAREVNIEKEIVMEIQFPLMGIMILPIINGLITSILLETFILSRQMRLKEAFNTAIGMSLISMIAMEVSMNTVDVVLTGGRLMGQWTGFCLKTILSVKIKILGCCANDLAIITFC